MSISIDDFLKVKREIEASPFERQNYSAAPGFSWAYLRYRLMRPFLKQKYNRYQKNHPKEPWLSPDAIRAFKLLSQNLNLGLEYGSGRSTAFFAPFFEKYVSIEHEEAWFQQVKDQLSDLTQVDYHLIKAEEEVPQQHLSSIEQIFTSADDFPVQDSLFKSYSDFVLSFDDEYFDFILVDGRARRTCALNALDKIKSGGILVLDNAERKRYAEVLEQLSDWPQIFTTTGLTDTLIWRKP